MTEQASDNPWQDAPRNVVFLADTHNRVERSIIRDWLRSTDPRGPSAAPVDVVHIGLERGKTMDLRRLRTVLDLPETALLVPLRVAWLPERDPEHSAPRLRDLLVGDPRHPRLRVAGHIQRRRPDGYACLAGAPATVGDLRRRHVTEAGGSGCESEDLESFVVRHAEIALDVRERTLHGRRYKVPRHVTDGIQSSSGYSAAIDELATTLDRPAEDIRKESRGYLRELVATPSTFFIDWMGTLTRWITSLGYARVVTDPENLQRARDAIRDHPTALLWTHKSHMDGIALLSVLYDNDFPAPHSLGGRNMAVGPTGLLGQRAGIIYIRRSFSDNPVYKVTLQQYLGFLMSKRFPISWAFEGTRSRNGKLGRPRYGLLKYVIDAAHATQTEDLHLIPVSISYDLIGETAEYAREETGQPKEAESFSWLMGYLHRLRAPMGNIYLDFADPVVLEGPAPGASRELLAEVAFEVARRTNGLVPVTLPALMCMALLMAAPRALTDAELESAMRELLGWLKDRDVRLADSFAEGDVEQLERIAEHTFEGGVVERLTDAGQTYLAIGQNEYPAASYYRNTIIHYFVNKALCEVALAGVADSDPTSRLDDFWAEVRWLRDLTKFEFFHTPSDDLVTEIDRELSSYDPAWRDVLGSSGDEVRELAAAMRPLVAHVVLLPFLEGYWLAARAVAETSPESPTTEGAIVSRAIRLGQLALRQQQIASEASIGKAVFKGAYSYLEHQGLLETGAPALDEDRRALVARIETRISLVRRTAQPVPVD